jgi:PAS domain-containing protein
MPELGLGIAIKMDDGNNSRACEVVLSALVARLLPLDDDDAAFMQGLADLSLRNWNGIEVGRLAATPDLWVRAMLGAMLFWLFVTSLERASLDITCKSSMALSAWVAIPLVPMLWTLFVQQYVRSDPDAVAMRWRVLTALVYVLIAGAVVINDRHGLLYAAGSGIVDNAEGVPRMHYARGPLYWAVAIWGYALLLHCALLVLRAWRAAPGSDGRHWAGFLVISLVPMTANAAYVLGGVRLYGSDPTPMSFAVAGLGLTWLILRNRLFDLVPMARGLLFTELPDPLLVVDPEQRVVEANAAALQLAGHAPRLGTPLASWPRIGMPLSVRLASPDAAPLRLQDPEAFYDVQLRTLGAGRRHIGTLLHLHDVTGRENERRQVMQHLAQRDAEQALLRDQALRDPLTGLWTAASAAAPHTAARVDRLGAHGRSCRPPGRRCGPRRRRWPSSPGSAARPGPPWRARSAAWPPGRPCRASARPSAPGRRARAPRARACAPSSATCHLQAHGLQQRHRHLLVDGVVLHQQHVRAGMQRRRSCSSAALPASGAGRGHRRHRAARRR